MKTLVVIPSYNEIKNIPSLLNKIFSLEPNLNVLVVDDNSPDGTGKYIDDEIKNNTYQGKLFVLHRLQKSGLGTAYIEGFKWELQHNYDAFISMDGDLSHSPQYLKVMLQNIKDNDLVIGSRYIRGGGCKNWDLKRKILSRGGNIYAQCLLFSKIHDLTGGFNCYTADFLRRINLDTILSKGYCFQIEMKFRHSLAKAKIKEIPIIFTDRTAGESKINDSIIKEAILKVFILSCQRFKIKRLMNV